LFCKTGELRGTAFDLGDEATVGSSSDNAVVLPVKTVSKRHARIFFSEQHDRYFVEDLGSRNGTRVDGTRVSGDERLDDLSVITFAEVHDFIFQRVAAGQTLPPIEPAAKPRAAGRRAATGDTVPEIADEPMVMPKFQPASGAPDGGPGGEVVTHVVLEVQIEGEQWTRFDLVEGANLVGRSRGCQVVIADDKLSRRHALLIVGAHDVKVRDLQTTNHTYVNGERVDEEIEVTEDVTLGFGRVKGRLVWRK
jgi:pSer/pThr/pTyr-binding forkhead associated (FHA) protein